MSPEGKNAVRKIAARVWKDPTAANVSDAKKMAAALLLLFDGRLPK